MARTLPEILINLILMSFKVPHGYIKTNFFLLSLSYIETKKVWREQHIDSCTSKTLSLPFWICQNFEGRRRILWWRIWRRKRSLGLIIRKKRFRTYNQGLCFPAISSLLTCFYESYKKTESLCVPVTVKNWKKKNNS